MYENHIIIGIGGTGGNILKSLRKKLFRKTTADERIHLPLGFIYIDSNKDLMQANDPTWKVSGVDAQLGKECFLDLGGAPLKSRMENCKDFPGFREWIGDWNKWEKSAGYIFDIKGTSQRRRLGRFLFACAANEYERILKNQVKLLQAKSGRGNVTFHIIAGLAGGTGSGAIVDVIAQTRKLFRASLGGARYQIFVYGFVPEQIPLPYRDLGFYHANGYAALQELNALQVGRYIPRDVTGQDEYVSLENCDHVFDSCFLFTNTDENGLKVDSRNDLPDIVSDFIFKFLDIHVDENTNAFLRTFSSEGMGGAEKENDENAKTTEIAYQQKPVCSRRFHTFSTKRIIIPEDEIVEYLTFNFAKQSLLQSIYNNWSDDLGYRDQPKNEDYISFVNDKATLNGWMLSDMHLILSLPVFQSDKDHKWKNIRDEWNSVIPILANEAWGKEKARAINELAKLCDERFDEGFRKVGVPKFYKIKEQEKKDIAKEICKTIERDLFNQWQSGQVSVDEIERLIELLLTQTEIRWKSFDEKIYSFNEEIEKLLEVKNQNESDWANLGLIAVALGKNRKLYDSQICVLQDLYIKKTEIEGFQFAQKLLLELLSKLQFLRNEVKRFSEMLIKTVDATEKEIASRCREQQLSAELYMLPVVKLYDSADIQNFTSRVVRDQQIQSDQSSATRNTIASLSGSEKPFTKLNEHTHVDSLMDIFAKNARESAIQAYNEVIKNKKEKLIGINIIDQLKAQFGTPDKQEELIGFARNIMASNGVLLSFDNFEITRHLKNNDPPCSWIMKKSTFISIPESPENCDFTNKLIDAFKQFAEGYRDLWIDAKSQRKNEITFINLTSCFSLRMVNEVKYLKHKYDVLTNGADAEISKWMLHTEGDGSQFPKLFTLTQEELKDARKKVLENLLPYILIAKCLDIIVFADRMDGTGRKAFCIMNEDEDGFPLPPVILGEKITQIIDSDVLDADWCTEIMDSVQAKLADEYFHITKREELEEALKNLFNNIILPEYKNKTDDPTFIKFWEAGRKALKIIKS